MRFVPLSLSVLALGGCAMAYAPASAVVLADGTWRIEGPRIAYESDLPNRKKAAQICPDGYTILKKHLDRDGLGANTLIWIVDCN